MTVWPMWREARRRSGVPAGVSDEKVIGGIIGMALYGAVKLVGQTLVVVGVLKVCGVI